MRFYRRKKDISIHAPTRGATPHRGGLEEAMRISIHAPTRGATYTHAPPLTKTSISIHAPTRGATGELRKPRRSRHNFNPRSHKGSDGVFCWLHEQQGKISIHAPTRGATILRHELIHAFLYISIHAPTRGATKWIPCCGQSAHISIHAPARGATNSASMMSALSLFQSTLPQGERRQWFRVRAESLPFQSTLPQGERRLWICQCRVFGRISIHAPTRGATTTAATGPGLYHPFQSTLPQGERPQETAPSHFTATFQSTLPQGERQWSFTAMKIPEDFNPRSHKGSDAAIDLFVTILEISIHAPTRGAT